MSNNNSRDYRFLPIKKRTDHKMSRREFWLQSCSGTSGLYVEDG